MATVIFTQNLQRHVRCAETVVGGCSVRDVLENVFRENPRARPYVLDDQSALRRHVIIFVDGEMVRDRTSLSDTVADTSTVYVLQALSGG